MADFMFIYRGGKGMSEHSPEEMQQLMQKWMDWIQTGTEAGWLVDGGDALLDEGRVLQTNGTVTDGPHAEAKELVGGYSLVRAANLDEALGYAKTCPHHNSGQPGCMGDIEIRELAKTGEQAENAPAP